MRNQSKEINWFSKQVMAYPINAGVIFIGIPQYFILWLIGFYNYHSHILTIVYILFSIGAIGIYTSYAAYLRGRSKWWGIGLIFGLIIISWIGIRGERTPTLFGLSAMQFLSMFGVLGFGLHAIFNKNIFTGLIAIGILVFIIWYTKKHK